jgi:hypothetical protein
MLRRNWVFASATRADAWNEIGVLCGNPSGFITAFLLP